MEVPNPLSDINQSTRNGFASTEGYDPPSSDEEDNFDFLISTKPINPISSPDEDDEDSYSFSIFSKAYMDLDRTKPIYEYTDLELETYIDNPKKVPRDKETFDKLRKYLKQVEESEGFDIDDYPGYNILGLVDIFPEEVSRQLYPQDYENYVNLAKLAMQSYNDEEQTHYEVEQIEKVNLELHMYKVYYLTFSAKACGHDQSNVRKTFRAKVGVNMVYPSHENVVYGCGIHPSS